MNSPEKEKDCLNVVSFLPAQRVVRFLCTWGNLQQMERLKRWGEAEEEGVVTSCFQTIHLTVLTLIPFAL
jgi:hypothetical protein